MRLSQSRGKQPPAESDSSHSTSNDIDIAAKLEKENGNPNDSAAS